MRIIQTFLIALSPMLVFAQKENVASPFTALTHVNVIDATGLPVQSNMTVVINGNRIFALGKTGKVAIPENAIIINAKGKYLIPGLWDMHMHFFEAFGSNDYRFTLSIVNGVTGVREMWTKMDDMPQVNLWRKQFYEHSGTIPRLGYVGTMVDGTPPVWPGSDTATTAGQARLLVQRIKASGIDFVKVYNNLSREAYFAIGDESKKLNIPFAGHLPFSILLKEASEAGQQSIEHLTGNNLNIYFDCATLEQMVKTALSDSIAAMRLPPIAAMKDALELCDVKKTFTIFQQTAKNGTWQCPSLVLLKRRSLDDNLLFNSQRLKYIPLLERQRWETKTAVGLKSRTQEQKEAELKSFQRAMGIIYQMKKSGIQFLAGTDVPNHYLYSGFSLHDELALLVEAGLTPMEALQTATINPAIFLGTTDSLGTIEKGKIADMILLDANPLTDIRNTQLIKSVFVNGKYLSKKTLQTMLLEVEAAANKK
ncbi:MAG TPA: amidohydrolase family protein [Ferruginibacter sp.]|nr:amidohydrolase family protein [Ferruginibacter sp.]